MLVALNNKGKRIYANPHLKRSEEYYCPECGEKLI